MHNQELGFPPVRTERSVVTDPGAIFEKSDFPGMPLHVRSEDELAHTFDGLSHVSGRKRPQRWNLSKKSKSTVREFYLAVGATETIAFWMASSKSRADVHCLTKHT